MIDPQKIYNDFLSYIVVTIGSAVVGGGWWMIRRVFTNQKMLEQNKAECDAKIELMVTELRSRDALRNEDRDRMGEIEKDIRESRRDIQEIKNALIVKS